MADFLFYLIPVALLAVLVVLGLGIYGLFKGGEFAEKYGNKLMRWRVGLQFAAILILIGAAYLKSQAGS